MLIGERIKNKRINLNMTQDDLALKLQISKSLVSSYENDKKKPRFNNLIKLIEVLETTPNDLLSLDYVVKDEEEQYLGMISKEEVKLINEMRKDPKLYKILIDDPKRTLELICRKIF